MRYRSSDAMLEYGDLRSSGSADPAAVNIPMSRRNRQARVTTVFVFMVVSTVPSISTGCSTIPENVSGNRAPSVSAAWWSAEQLHKCGSVGDAASRLGGEAAKKVAR